MFFFAKMFMFKSNKTTRLTELNIFFCEASFYKNVFYIFAAFLPIFAIPYLRFDLFRCKWKNILREEFFSIEGRHSSDS